MSRGKSITSGKPSNGWMRLGGRFSAARLPLRRGVSLRCSWQPTQPVVSPGMTAVKLCMRLTDNSLASSATKKRLRMAGTSR